MPRIAIVIAACAFAMIVSATVAAEEPTAEIAAKDAAVVNACLDVAEARRVAADAVEAAEAANAVSPDETKKETGPEGHLEAAALTAGYAPESCIGVLSDPCMETEEAASTYGMMDCYGRESEVWDARLDASYRESLAPRTGPGSNAANDEMEAKQLRKIQAAWTLWRDATCEVLYSDGIPIYGSSAKVEAVYCDMVLTARQALWMEGLSTLGFE